MNICSQELYHIYNQGNNREQIFYSPSNYLYFLQKYRQYVFPYCETLAFCLMPNHFHFLIYTNNHSLQTINAGQIQLNRIENGFRLLLSRFAQSINKQQNRTGSLFRQKTKAKLLDTNQENYAFACFQYIHQNPLQAGLVNRLEDWEFSSFRDYAQFRNGNLCNKERSEDLFHYQKSNFYEESYQLIDSCQIDKFYR